MEEKKFSLEADVETLMGILVKLVSVIDYDVGKQYNEETAEDPDEVKDDKSCLLSGFLEILDEIDCVEYSIPDLDKYLDIIED